jgi:uncharacterized protein (DUF4415 family)
MSEEHIVTYTLEELGKLQAEGKTETDWERVDALTDGEIEAAAKADPDAQPTDEAFWKDAMVVVPGEKEQILISIDKDVLQFFKAKGQGYQARMNAVLRRYVDSQKKKVGSYPESRS